MMKTPGIKVFSMLLFVLLHTSANAQWNIEWSLVYDNGNHSDEKNEILLPDPSGGLFCIGYTFPLQQQKSDILILKYDDNGNLSWSEQFTRSGDRNERPYGAIVDHAGNLIITGEAFNVNNIADILVLKYSASGQLMWEDSIDGTSSLYDRGNSVCVDDSDNIYITGYIYNNAFKGFVAKYSPSGSLMYNSVVSSLQQGHHIRFESNYLYLYGITGTSGSPNHTQVLKLDKNSATQNSYTINDAYDNTIMQMIRENNQIYLLDSRGGGSSGYTSYAVHCLDSNLTFLWKNTHAGSAHLIPCNMVSYDTSLYVSSFEWNGAMSLQYSASLSRLSKTDGSIIAQVPVNANPVMSTRIFDLKADSIGNLSVAHLTTGNASGNYIKYLSHFDRNLQPLGLLALPDSMTYGDIYLYQKDDHTIYYSSAAWDSIGGNGDFLLYKLSDIAVSTSEFAGDKLLKVFPNPFAESATIISENKGEVRWRLTDMDGRLLDKGIVKTEQQLFFPHIQAGVYLLTCTDGRSTQTVKLVKHR